MTSQQLREDRVYFKDERNKLLAEVERLHASRATWIRAFNRLEKAVTNHIRDCIDSDGLAHAHKAVMRDLTEKLR